VLPPIAILTNRYQSLFGGAITYDTIHAAFRIPVAGGEQHSINYGLAKYQLVVIDEASVVSTNSFSYITGTLNKLVSRPVVLAGDERQQQRLRIAGGRTRQAQSMLKYEHYQQLNNKCPSQAVLMCRPYIRVLPQPCAVLASLTSNGR